MVLCALVIGMKWQPLQLPYSTINYLPTVLLPTQLYLVYFTYLQYYSCLGAASPSRSPCMVIYLWYISYVRAYRINITNPIERFVLGWS